MYRKVGICFFVFSMCFVANLFASESSSVSNTADAALLADLETARQTWLETSSFYGHYTYKRTVFFSEEDAESKEIDDKRIVSEGVICKKQDKCRLQVLYKKPPRESSPGVYEDRSSDSIVNRDYRILFNPSQGKSVSSGGYLTRVENENLGASILELSAQKTPFALFLDPINSFPGNMAIDSEPSYSDLGEGRAKISFSAADSIGNKSTKDVVIRISTRVPVIESIIMHFSNRDKTTTSSLVALEWRESCGLEIPTRLRSVYGPQRPVNMDKDIWIVSEWESDDLTSREPEDGDFVLKLNKGEKLAGMRTVPKDGLVDLDQITDDDLFESGELDYSSYGSDTDSDRDQNLPLWVRLFLSLVGAVLILLFFVTRKRNRA